jgi:hypothetical protein
MKVAHLITGDILMRREGIKPPKFADKFARIDFESEPLPILCMYPIPEPVALESLRTGC